MWHELVLHGIGGRTIAEAKQHLSYVEALEWWDYIRRRGTLNWGTRLEGGFALQATLIANKGQGVLKKADGSKFTTADFMPHADKDDEDIDKKLMKRFGVNN